MITEIDYNDVNGSICPICGDELEGFHAYDGVSSNQNVTRRYGYAVCVKAKHLIFIKTETYCGDDGYDFYIRVMIPISDFEDLETNKLKRD